MSVQTLSQSETQAPGLNLMVALACEAKPLIDHYRLIKNKRLDYPYFSRSADVDLPYDINLVVCGIGQINMAAACGWLGGLKASQSSAWLNIGIAGHRTYTIGEIIRVVKSQASSINVMTNQCHYPPLVAKWGGENASLKTVNSPNTDYLDEFMVDMEASAFFTVARQFANSELIQSLKVISDNIERGTELLNSSRISNLLAAKIPQISRFANSLVKLVPLRVAPAELVPEIRHLHCTASQLLQYQELVNKLANIGVNHSMLKDDFATAKTIKELLEKLRRLQLEKIPELVIG